MFTPCGREGWWVNKDLAASKLSRVGAASRVKGDAGT